MILYTAEAATQMALDAIQILGMSSKTTGTHHLQYRVNTCRILSVNLLLLLVSGGNGYINDYPTGRFLRDAKLYEIGAGTSEVRRLIIGRAINAHYK